MGVFQNQLYMKHNSSEKMINSFGKCNVLRDSWQRQWSTWAQEALSNMPKKKKKLKDGKEKKNKKGKKKNAAAKWTSSRNMLKGSKPPEELKKKERDEPALFRRSTPSSPSSSKSIIISVNVLLPDVDIDYTKIAGKPDQTIESLLEDALNRIKKRIKSKDMTVFEKNEFGFTFENSDEFLDSSKVVKEVLGKKNVTLCMKIKPVVSII